MKSPEPGGRARAVEGEDRSNRGRDVDDLTFQILQERAFRAPCVLQESREWVSGMPSDSDTRRKRRSLHVGEGVGETASPLLSLQAGADGSSCFISLLGNRFFFFAFFFLNYGGREERESALC